VTLLTHNLQKGPPPDHSLCLVEISELKQQLVDQKRELADLKNSVNDSKKEIADQKKVKLEIKAEKDSLNAKVT
jgi:hypothetical protein